MTKPKIPWRNPTKKRVVMIDTLHDLMKAYARVVERRKPTENPHE